MNSRERVLSALARTGYDRIPVIFEGTPEITQQLLDHFGLTEWEDLARLLGVDLRNIGADYVGPELRTLPDGSWEGLWGERYNNLPFEGGTYPEAVYLVYENIDTVEELEKLRWPSPDWFDFSTIPDKCRAYKGEYAISFGGAGDLDFINGISRCRGMEKVLMDLLTENEAFMEIMERRFRFFLECHRRALEAAGGLIDISHIGEDLGNQRGPMISMEMFEKHFAPKYKAHFEMAHSYGAKTKMHMCGCVRAFLPRLIELGLDIYDVVQPTTPEMDIAVLQRDFGQRLNFSGSMCVQSVLPHGTPADVAAEVERRLELFKDGGLMLGPTHAIQVRTPIENVIAMYRAAGSLDEAMAAACVKA